MINPSDDFEYKQQESGIINNNNSTANSNTRKRKNDYADSSSGNPSARSKRSNNDTHHETGQFHQHYNSSGQNHQAPTNGDVHLKLLVPSALAGSIIGRGGERISQLQKDTECRVKMSKSNEFYPNTNERICLIIGSVEQVVRAHDVLLERMHEKTESSRTHEVEHSDRINQIKLLIPRNTAGLIIGRSGAIIKQIKDESGAFIQISSKDTDQPERVLTIDGEAEKRLKAFEIVVRKIAEDPLHNSVPMLSYGPTSALNDSYGGSGTDMPSNMSGYANNGMLAGAHSIAQQQAATNKISDFNSAAYYLAGINNLALLIVNCGGSFQMTPEGLKNALRSSGFPSNATIDIIDAITVLMNYGLITKIPPATILSSNPALSQFANISYDNSGGNFSNLTNILAASIASTINTQNGLSSSLSGGFESGFENMLSGAHHGHHHSHHQQNNGHNSNNINSSSNGSYHSSSHMPRKVNKR